MEQIPIKLNEKEVTVQIGKKIQEIINEMKIESSNTIVAAIVENKIESLNYQIKKPVEIVFIDLSSELGMRIYARSLSFVFIRAAKEIIPQCSVSVEHSMAKGLYCEIKGKTLTLDLIKKIERRMQEIIAADEPIIRKKISRQEGIELFKKENRMDIVKRLRYSSKDEECLYKCGLFYDLFDGTLVASTGYLKLFKLKFHLPGVIIQHPTHYSPNKLPEYIPQPKLANIFRESEHWGEILEVDTVGALNECIVNNKSHLLVQISEALHEKKIANIADQINERKDHGNIILIAGPSSSGKTTFAKRLMIQLMVNGLRPVAISVDDYFINREDTPKDENGNYDFEALEAIDLELFNDHLTQLIQGQEIEIPTFNFKTGKRECQGKKLKIDKTQPIVIEGIHGLNEKLTYSIPKDHKFKIYISALTQLNIDKHNRIHTTDTRKIRRLVRDYQFRGTEASETLKMWYSVRRGEEKNIFPFQEEADVMFNSSLIYELSILKNYAKPLLVKITPEDEEYIEAQRLLRFLEYFLPIESNQIPLNSILKEFIG